MFKYVRISSFYPAAIRYYYQHFPEMSTKNYAEQYRHFMDQYFGMSDSYEKELSALGVQTNVIPLNVEPLQKKWAEENQFQYTCSSQLVLCQLLQFKPEVLFIGDYRLFDEQYFNEVREKVKSIKLFIGSCCSPYNEFSLNFYKKCDFVLCCCQQLAEELQQHGIRTHVVLHGFDESLLSEIPPLTHKVKVLFTGSILAGSGFHQQRYELIKTLLNEDIDLTIYGAVKKENYLLVSLKQFIYILFSRLEKYDKTGLLKTTWLHRRILSKNFPQHFGIDRKLRKKIFPPKFGLDMFRLLREADICLNIHGDIASKDAANMRLFEATGMGTCLVTDWKANMCSLFDDGSEVITYKDAKDCAEKIKWLLQHPEHRERIAQAGQKRCLTQHTIRQRVQQLYAIIIQELK